MVEAIDKLEKAEVLLQNWTEEYIFNKKPNPGLIFEKGDTVEKEQTLKWNGEYENITTLIRIVQDYVSGAKNAMLEADQ